MERTRNLGSGLVIGLLCLLSTTSASAAGFLGEDLTAKVKKQLSLYWYSTCVYNGTELLACETYKKDAAIERARRLNQAFAKYSDKIFTVETKKLKGVDYTYMLVTKHPDYDPNSLLPEREQPGRETF